MRFSGSRDVKDAQRARPMRCGRVRRIVVGEGDLETELPGPLLEQAAVGGDDEIAVPARGGERKTKVRTDAGRFT
jgi:hypothetical protein